MHEMSIAQNIIEIVDEISRENQVRNVRKVIVKIGKLVAVVPDSLQFCYEAITKGTPLENSELEIHIIPIVAKCHNCKRTFEVESYFFICPFCESSEVKILQGEEFNVSELEVDE
jgi:hydrogenase nickel incorporation protein HypA/HybF